VIKEVSELLGQFKIDLPAWFFEATGTHRAGVLLLLLLGVGLAGGGRLVLGHLHDKVAPID
jgi:hypothetical protein